MELTPIATTAAMFVMASAVNQEASDVEVLMDSTLTLLSVAGSLGGGFMAVGFAPPQKDPTKKTLRRDAVRWLSCSIFGGSFTPFTVEYLASQYPERFAVETGSVLAVSASLGLFAWLIVSLVPLLLKMKLGIKNDESNQ